MPRYVVALALAAGLVFGGSAAGAVNGIAPPDPGPTPRAAGSIAIPRPPLARVAVPTAVEPGLKVLGPPEQAAPDLEALVDGFWSSPAAALLAPLHLPGVGGRARHPERPPFDLANRPRTGRKFPRLPTAVAGGQGDPFAALPTGGYAAYGTGTAYHTDAGLSGDRGSDIDLGFAGATYSSTPAVARFDELSRRVAPPLKASGGYGQGDAAEVGALESPGGGGPDIATGAEASAPPTKAPVSNEQTDIAATPFLDADILHAEAGARSAATGCVVGSDLAYGLGSATDSKALPTGADESTVSTDGEGPPRAVSQSVTRARLVPRTGTDRFGLLTETRQTIAPITIRRGTPEEMTIEVAGEWILSVMVDGARSRLDYGPDADSPQTTVLRVTRPEHPGKKDHGKTIEVATVTLQQLLDNDGAIVDITDNVELVVGELPRGIRDDHGSFPVRTTTRVAAASDVVRIVLKDMPGADLRVGHMEAAAAVPADGIACPGIGMAKSLDSASVRPGDRFTWAIDVTNPNDCVLDKVNVLDTISATAGVRYHVVSSDPPTKKLTDGSVTFEGIGPLRQGESRRLLIDAAVDDVSAPGSLKDVAVADGVCRQDRRGDSDASDSGSMNAPVPMSGRAELAGPAVGALRLAGALPSVTATPAVASKSATIETAVVERQRVPLAHTGGVLSIVPAWMLISGGSVLRRVKRRSR
jgi:hypothetical protein